MIGLVMVTMYFSNGEVNCSKRYTRHLRQPRRSNARFLRVQQQSGICFVFVYEARGESCWTWWFNVKSASEENGTQVRF
jgi:hypothetical protein